MIIYGLMTCPDCQKAQRALKDAGKDFTFRDVRAQPLDAGELAEMLREFGDRLVDRNTNDYRGLSTWLKNSEADAQIEGQPKVMARPVIRDGDAWHLGWDGDVEAAITA